jgi:hypothetical protein
MIIRKELVKKVFMYKMEISPLGSGIQYVEHPILERDIRSCIHDESGSVKIIWAPPGTGKTTSVFHVLDSELKEENISGVLMLTPPSSLSLDPEEWFRKNLMFSKFETLTQVETLSSIIDAPPEKPYVIGIDQCDYFIFNDKLKTFIKVMAEDNHRTKKYVVLVLCADATNASTMNEWNGGVKIKLVNDDHLAYKWSNAQIDRWIELNMKDHKTIDLVKDRKHYNKFKKTALVAGTPDFLITNSTTTEHKTKQQIENSWNAKSISSVQIWKSGLLLTSKSGQSTWW